MDSSNNYTDSEEYKERRKYDENIENLIPSDREEFKKVFKIKNDSDVDYYRNDLRTLLHMVYPDITWDKDTSEVIVKGRGIIKGQKILALFSEFMEIEDWIMYTMGGSTAKEERLFEIELIDQLKYRFLKLERC